MKLYIYDHCPYCVKARMIFGLKNVDVDIVTLLNDDEEKPKSMIGKKMVPILEKEDGSYMPESMDIISYIDENYGDEKIINSSKNEEIGQWLSESREYVYKLAMPRWIKCELEEFKTQSAIDYFQKKKEGMIGSFEDNLKESDKLIGQANNHLKKLAELLHSEESAEEEISETDIHLFPALRSLTVVEGIEFPEKVFNYLKNMSDKTEIILHFNVAV